MLGFQIQPSVFRYSYHWSQTEAMTVVAMIQINPRVNRQPADKAWDDHHQEESLRMCAELEHLSEFSTHNIARCTALVRRLKSLGKRIKRHQLNRRRRARR